MRFFASHLIVCGFLVIISGASKAANNPPVSATVVDTVMGQTSPTKPSSAEEPIVESDLDPKDNLSIKNINVSKESNSMAESTNAPPVQQNSITKNNKEAPSLEGVIKGWNIMKVYRAGRKICYLVTYPYDSVGNHKEARDAYLIVAHMSNMRQELSIHAGYEYRKGGPVNISIDGDQFVLIGEGYSAKPKNIEDEIKIINKVLNAEYRILVRSDSSIGTYAVDTYLLDGFHQAYIEMIKICHVKN